MNNENMPNRDSVRGANNPPMPPKRRVQTHPQIKAKNKKYRERHELNKKLVLLAFASLSLILLIGCVLGAYSYAGDSIRVISQNNIAFGYNEGAYTIVYSDKDTWGYSTAISLRDIFAEKTGATLRIVADSEPVGMHEIRIGHTNRASDDYITSAAALGTEGYAIVISSGDSVSITAFSANGAAAAIKYFLSSYVGAYRPGKLTFSNKMNFFYVSRSGEEPNVSLRESKVTLTCRKSGKFKVLILSDPDISIHTLTTIDTMISTEKPGLVIFAGDISFGFNTKAQLEDYVKILVDPLEKSKTPWTVILGEQDTSKGLSAEQQMEVFSSFPHCIAKSDFVADGAISSFIPVYAYGDNDKNGAPIFGVWTMGQTTMLSLSGGGIASEPLFSGKIEAGTDYGYVPSSHLAWLSESDAILDRATSGEMPSIVVTHTPVPEFSSIAAYPEKTMMVGTNGEPVSSSPINSGLFAAVLGIGGARGLYCGHDHLNSFSGKYCGIELGYSASIGYDGYGFGGTFETNNSLRGGRIVEFTVGEKGVSVTSRMEYAADYGLSRP